MTHPALLKAMEVYDRSGDLAPHQQAFLQSVHMATMACVRTRSKAIQDHGYGSEMAEAIAEHAYQMERSDLAAALAAYKFEQMMHEQALEDE